MAAIDAAMNELNSRFQAASQDLYNAQQQAGANPNAGANPGQGAAGNNGSNGEDVTDVPFEEVK